MRLTVGILAGELSGDLLGAGLMRSLQDLVGTDQVRFVGVGGPRMQAAGLDSLFDMERLSVNGFVEPIRRFPELLRLLLQLRRHFLSEPPDVFVGVDFNVFNLLLERQLKKAGILTAHYVSPSVYAWRRGRIKRIARAADLVMALYPFEPPLYEDYDVRAEFVGHPMADDIPLEPMRMPARQALGFEPDDTLVALLPGSRRSEVSLLGQLMLEAAQRIQAAEPDVQFLVPCVSPGIEAQMKILVQAFPDLPVHLLALDGRQPLAAADVALVKSGTGTLEAMLLGTPMVVTYRLGTVSYWIVRALKRSRFVALPNIIADQALVPELLQDEATPDALASAVLEQLAQARAGQGPRAEFAELHRKLRRQASLQAARAVLRLVSSPVRAA